MINSAAKTYIEPIMLQRAEENLQAVLCFCSFPAFLPFDDLAEALHPREEAYYKELVVEKRRRNYLIGRYAAKQAVAAFVREKDLRRIAIQPGVFNQPVVRHGTQCNVQVSISHCDDFGAALAFSEIHPMAIDIERINTDKNSVLETHVTGKEQEIIRAFSCSYEEKLTLLWTVKESLSKILKTGLTAPFHIFEISKIEKNCDHAVCYFENFAQYKALSFNLGNYVCSLVSPKKTEMQINFPALRQVIG